MYLIKLQLLKYTYQTIIKSFIICDKDIQLLILKNICYTYTSPSRVLKEVLKEIVHF